MFSYLICAVALFVLPAMAKDIRIISGTSTVTETILALGAQDKLVTIDQSSRVLVDDGSLPMVGYHRQLPIEGMLALKPTHLIGSDEMGSDTILNIMKSASVHVEIFPSGNALQDFDQRIDKTVALTGTQAKATKIKADVLNKVNNIQAEKPSKTVNVMFMMFSKDRSISVAGKGTTIDSVIKLASGTNPSAATFSNYEQISIESLLQMQPDIILIPQRVLDNNGGLKGLTDYQPLIAATPAFKDHRVIGISSTGLASLSLTKDLHDRILAAADKS